MILLDNRHTSEGMMDPEEIEAVYYSHLLYRNLCRRSVHKVVIKRV